MRVTRVLSVRFKKPIALSMLTIMGGQLLIPAYSYGLSSGPTQPEVQSFEPVGTTDMVDMFTGDFVYNIPLMDVEGYPVNISYHGGVTMDQEASWVGLGWNISPGAVNRTVRGLPDEFAGETIEKELNIRPEQTVKLGVGAVLEAFGVGQPAINISASLGGYLNINNYKGMSVDLLSKAGVNGKFGPVSAGMNIGASLGSQAGASINYEESFGVGISGTLSQNMSAGGSFNLNKSGVYSPRTGLRKSIGFGVSTNVSAGAMSSSVSSGANVQIGLNNYSAALTNTSSMYTAAGQLKGGGEAFWLFGSGKISGSLNTIRYESDGSRPAYGYLHLSEASKSDLLDFSREKDVMYNTTMQLLPQTHLTYDVYNLTGQGTGGSFRPFRNDFGAVFDPITVSKEHTNEAQMEAGLGNLFSLGGEEASARTTCETGAWQDSDFDRPFRKLRDNNVEDIYYKEAGELTPSNETFVAQYANDRPVEPSSVRGLPAYKPNSEQRIPRANHIFTLTADAKDTLFLLGDKNITSYTDTNGFKNYPSVGKEIIPRADNSGNALRRHNKQITEIVQTQKDGRRYVYGLPVVNNVQKEVAFSVDADVNAVDEEKNLVDYTPGVEDTKNNTRGVDNFFSSTVTPTFVSAHLLTAVLSADYIDVSGNGITEDDLGTYTKFNYTRKSADYRWRAPIQSGKAMYQKGYLSDRRDDKASYMIGSREQWMLHSVETKNYVAEFYVSPRKDAMGVLDRILNGGLANSYNQAPYNAALSSTTKDNRSYKLDSIVLYNKHTRFSQGAAAEPIKTIVFDYDYSLCKNVPNSEGGAGKLTLRKISFRYGRSNLSAQSPYVFNYSSVNPDYNEGSKDRWGNYKQRHPDFTNYEFPFTAQSASTDSWASAWSLTEIKLPSGGVIKVDYESDDYGFVQNMGAMEMFQIEGFGNGQLFRPSDLLYKKRGLPYLYIYFKRRKESENSAASPKDNYLNGTNILYFNVTTNLRANKFEQIKGYAEVVGVGYCQDDDNYGYVQVAPRIPKGTGDLTNPITYTALNTGRYSIPHIMFEGADPDKSSLDNMLAGMKQAIHELFGMLDNPLGKMMDASRARNANFVKSFIRLTIPGQRKKGGGHRIKSIKYYDSWDKMAQGDPAVYGRVYNYTTKSDDNKFTISSGVASYEPMLGADEIPQHIPVGYIAQAGNGFPPNDPVELYQEQPMGESFYPAPVVGYRKVTVSSIHRDEGRSALTEDIYTFHTAKDFPIQANITPIQSPTAKKTISLKDMTLYQQATQSFALVFNDMHGKQEAVEHWVIKPVDTLRGRELVSSQKYEYFMNQGRISNAVPVFDYSPNAGKMYVGSHLMGLETDVTIDSRSRHEESIYETISLNLNTALVLWPIPVPLGYPYEFTNLIDFRSASTMKVTQQYGILSRVISSNNGAVTDTRNEVFDKESGNVLVTSVNNEYGERQYTVNYPAHWAYKELGPIYNRHRVTDTFKYDLLVDSMGNDYNSRFINYNPFYSYQYGLSPTMPVARVIVDEDMGNFTLGDELYLQFREQNASPMKAWVMGFTSDLMHCYLILAPREPYKLDATWSFASSYERPRYTVVKPGVKNRLGETVQTYVTPEPNNIFPFLKDTLSRLVSLNAQRYQYNLNEVFAANKTSDSLNPFVTGKVGEYRPQQQVFNLKNRSYVGGPGRNAGLFPSLAYWKTETDRYAQYCPDTCICPDCPPVPDMRCLHPLDSFRLIFMGQGNAYREGRWWDPVKLVWVSDSIDKYANKIRMIVYPNRRNKNCILPSVTIPNDFSKIIGSDAGASYTTKFLSTTAVKDSIDFQWNNDTLQRINYDNGCCQAYFDVDCDYANGEFRISNRYYKRSGSSTMYTCVNVYKDSTLEYVPPAPLGAPICLPFRIRHKIFLSKVGHYDAADNENWVKASEVTRYNWFGQEIENKEEGLGYNAAVYGYNQQLPICVAKNAKHAEVLFEGFEDYKILKAVPERYASYMPLIYSPFEEFFKTMNVLDAFYQVTDIAPAASSASIVTADAHTGNYTLNAGSTTVIPLNGTGTGASEGYTFTMKGDRRYYASVWLKLNTPVTDNRTTYTPNGLMITMDTTLSATPSAKLVSNMMIAKTNLIEGWQKYEVEFSAPAAYKNFKLHLPGGYYYDDLRIHPFESNTKAFVYDENTRRLMATLDENNFASFYEYDAEGGLIRTKKETEKGILTITESRSSHQKKN